ncbi:MAG TPA: DUF2252 domain-containing protein [Thermoleophilaceae bacterium]|nr:DUF2252 domain-containing protein [Thermoleophilaceae bacterium]
MTATVATSAPAPSASGRDLRAEVPRSSHAEWTPAADRDPLAILEEQAATRLPELVPLRRARMAESPFAFYRGAARVMAFDLAETPTTGVRVQLCGDAHLSNFGGFASPERDVLFDLNDFDETLPGPWEWDVKRLAASVEIAARESDLRPARRRAMVHDTVAEYRRVMRRLASMKTLDVWYARVDLTELETLGADLHLAHSRRVDKAIAKARRKDSVRAFAKLAQAVDGTARIVARPPLVVPLRELVPDVEAREGEERIRALLHDYKATLPADRRHLLDRFRFADLARKVVGVGSVGTRCWIVLMLGRDTGDPLFLQVKEAGRSVLEYALDESEFDQQGQRVVEGQRLMQAASDIMLGWLRAPGIDGVERDFYVRTMWDWKLSADIGAMPPDTMAAYARLCGWTLAHAHARSGDGVAIASYLGSKEAFEKAVGAFASAYADQNELDHAALVRAIEDGELEAAPE